MRSRTLTAGNRRVRIGWVPGAMYAEVLQRLHHPVPVSPSHLRIDEATRPVKLFGNWNVEFTLHRTVRACSCEKEPRYSKLFNSPGGHIVHFGNCLYNTESALLCRQFASDKFPEVEHVLLFSAFVRWEWANRKASVLSALEDLDYSWETFISETHPKKRKIYQHGRVLFEESGRIVTKLMMFSKTNEVHHTSQPDDPRPRCLFDPHETLKAVGAYCARLMIAALKRGFPEFISGFNLPDLTKHVSDCLRQEGVDFSSENFYSYDGSGHDSHQSFELIEAVDHFITREILPEILQHSWIPAELHTEVMRVATLEIWSAYTIYGAQFRMIGTVFSGHPFRTTLFNTLRTIYYNHYVAWLAGCTNHVVFASGDDTFGHQASAEFYRLHRLLLSPCRIGIQGLGQVAKDLVVGPLEKHSFLSKRLYCYDGDLVIDRQPDKLLVSGTVSDKLDRLTVQEFCTMQFLQLSDLTDNYGALRARFASYGLAPVTQKMADILKYDWGYRLHLAKHPKPDAHHPGDPLASPYFMQMDKMHGELDGMPQTRVFLPREFRIGGTAFVRSAGQGNLNSPMARRKKQNRGRRGAPRPNRGGNGGRRRQRNQRPQVAGNGGNAVVAYNRAPMLAGPIAQQQANLRTRLGAFSALSLAEGAYLASLLNPGSAARSKIPGVGGGATSTVTLKQVVAFSTNATGFARLVLTPWRNGAVLQLANGAGVDENAYVAYVNLVSNNAAPNNLTTHMQSWRVVSASLSIVSTAPLLNAGGVISLTRYPALQVPDTTDTIRDHPSTKFFRSVDSCEIVYWPKGTESLELVSAANNEPGSLTSLYACISGATNAQQFVARIVINYEFVPTLGATDTYPPTATPLGNPMNVVCKYEPPVARKTAVIGGIGTRSKGESWIISGPNSRKLSKLEAMMGAVLNGPTVYRPVRVFAPGLDRASFRQYPHQFAALHANPGLRLQEDGQFRAQAEREAARLQALVEQLAGNLAIEREVTRMQREAINRLETEHEAVRAAFPPAIPNGPRMVELDEFEDYDPAQHDAMEVGPPNRFVDEDGEAHFGLGGGQGRQPRPALRYGV